MLNHRAHMHRARTSVKFLALLVYVVDREDVVEENVGGVRGHLVVVLTRRTWSGEEMVRERCEEGHRACEAMLAEHPLIVTV